MDKTKEQLYKLFAEILDYPSSSLAKSAGELAGLLGILCAEAAEKMQDFVSFTMGQSTAVLEETYTRTFDISPTTTLYVGYQLFGEDYKRGTFMARLQAEYKTYGFSCGCELPDYLPALLRFATVSGDPEFVNPLVQEGIKPAVDKMEKAFQEPRNGYALAVSSLRLFLDQECRQLVEAGGLQHG